MLFEKNQPLLVNAATAARLLGISERNFWQLKKTDTNFQNGSVHFRKQLLQTQK